MEQYQPDRKRLDGTAMKHRLRTAGFYLLLIALLAFGIWGLAVTEPPHRAPAPHHVPVTRK
jgi:hypothetical protein